MEIMAETLRLELAPFGVGVLSIVTGAVQTNGQTYFGDLELPEKSIYKPIEGTIKSRAGGSDGVKRMPTDEYAKKVVDDLCSGSTGRRWYGTTAGTIKHAGMVIPQGLMVSKSMGPEAHQQDVRADFSPRKLDILEGQGWMNCRKRFRRTVIDIDSR